MTYGDYLMVTRTFRQPGGKRARWCEETDIVFCTFCHPRTTSQVFTPVVQKHSSPATRGVLLCWAETIGCNGEGKCRGCPTLSFSKHQSLLTLLMPFLFFLNDGFRWRRHWPAEWCSAQTKLVSYLYFPFISNKRQVKRGNSHTLISSGDHLFEGRRPSLDRFEVLDTHRKEICEVSRHVRSRKGALLHNL